MTKAKNCIQFLQTTHKKNSEDDHYNENFLKKDRLQADQ